MITGKEYLKKNIGETNIPEEYYENEIGEMMDWYAGDYHQEQVKNLTIANVSNNEVALKAFVEEYVEAWEDGMGGDADLYRKAKSLL